MAQCESWFKQDLKKPIKVQMLNGNLFSQDNQGNLIGVEVFDNGEPASLAGTVSANIIRADGGTVAATGTLSGNKCSVVLPAAAYAIPGFATIVIKLTYSGVVTTLLALAVTIYRSSTDTAVDPGTVMPSIQSLIQQINTAVASIPADYSSLWTSLAPAFSTDASYVAGQHVTYNGKVYQFKTAHSGKWSAGDVSEVKVGNELTDLKNVLNNLVTEERKTNGIRNITDFVHGGPVNGYIFPLKLSDVTNRVRTKGFLFVNHGDTIVITPGNYKFAVWQWSGTPDSGSVVINRTWSTSTLTLEIPSTTDFIMVTYADKTDATAEIDLTAFDGTITITPYEQTQITNLEKTLNATRLNTNTDLNTVITPGYYTLMSNYTFTNLPEGAVGSAGLLFETKDSSINWQILFAVNNGKIFSRYKGSGNWNAWVEYTTEQQEERKSISILFVGNSLTQDGIAYLPYLLKTYYPEINFKFYMWYNGGYTLAQQYTAFQNNTPCQIFSVAENNASWTNYSNNKTMASVLSTYEFDIVSIQEYFNYKETYLESDLVDWNNCKDYITANYTGGNGLEFITLFHAPLRSNASEVFNLTKSGINLTLQKTICDDMIPNGIAVYRALSTDLDNLGDQGHLSPDGTHTQEGLPCLLQTYVTACWLFDRFGLARSVYGSPMRMTTAIYNTLNVPGANLGTGVITGTDAQNLLAQEVAIKAYKEGKYYVNNNIFNPN